MTIDQIIKEVNKFKKVSVRQVYRYLSEFEIRPLSKRFRQMPQQYPDDAAERIREELGSGVVKMNRLRSERAKALKARAA